jgi:hypothetical protein
MAGGRLTTRTATRTVDVEMNQDRFLTLRRSVKRVG